MKNIPPIYLYLISIVAFVLANLTREVYPIIYYILLLVGVVFFALGLFRRTR